MFNSCSKINKKYSTHWKQLSKAVLNEELTGKGGMLMEGWGCCRFGFFRILASKLDVWWLGEDLLILGDWFGKNTARKTRTVNYSWIEAINERILMQWICNFL